MGTKRISYKTIAHIAGQTAKAATMASAILAYYGVIGAKTTVLVVVLTTFGDLVASELAHRYPRGGITLKIYNTRRCKMQRGKKYCFWRKTYRSPKAYKVLP